jgi:hypothetical protein
MGEVLLALEWSLQDLAPLVASLLLPPWAVLVVVFVRNSEAHAVKLAAALGGAGALLANGQEAGFYFGSGALAEIGLEGSAAALVSGVVYGTVVGGLVSGLIRTLGGKLRLGPQNY